MRRYSEPTTVILTNKPLKGSQSIYFYKVITRSPPL